MCHPRAARRTLRESKPLCATPGLQDAPSGNLSRCVPPPGCKTHPPGIEPGSLGPKPIQYHYAMGACPKGQKKWLYRTTDWAWKGFAGIKKHNAQHPPNPPTKPAAKPPNNPPINETPPNNPPQPFGSGLQLTKGSCNDKKSLFPIIMIQKTSETKVFGNSAASTY